MSLNSIQMKRILDKLVHIPFLYVMSFEQNQAKTYVTHIAYDIFC